MFTAIMSTYLSFYFHFLNQYYINNQLKKLKKLFKQGDLLTFKILINFLIKSDLILIYLFQIIVTYAFNMHRITWWSNILMDSHFFQIICLLDFFWENAFQLLFLWLLYKILRFRSNVSLDILSFWICHFLSNFRKVYSVFILFKSQCIMP